MQYAYFLVKAPETYIIAYISRDDPVTVKSPFKVTEVHFKSYLGYGRSIFLATR